jgi:hypothetical protein
MAFACLFFVLSIKAKRVLVFRVAVFVVVVVVVVVVFVRLGG